MNGYLRNYAALFIADNNLQSAARIIFAYLRKPIRIEEVPQVGTLLYSLTRLVKKGYKDIPQDILNLIDSHCHSNFYEAGVEARRLRNQLNLSN